MVKKGQQLTEGPMDPHEILEVCGPQELQEHLVSEVQEVYRLQGVTINDKHIEIIVRQMLRKVRITEPGDTRSCGANRLTSSTSRRRTSAWRSGRQAGRGFARAARHHQGVARDRQLPQRRVVPGHNPRPDRGVHPVARGLPARLQGKRHHGPYFPPARASTVTARCSSSRWWNWKTCRNRNNRWNRRRRKIRCSPEPDQQFKLGV